MTLKTEMTDMFGRLIKKGESFMRIADTVGGAHLRFYFFAGFAADGRIMVQEYGGKPRIIKEPTCSLLLLDAVQMNNKNLKAPRLDDVLAKLNAKV